MAGEASARAGFETLDVSGMLEEDAFNAAFELSTEPETDATKVIEPTDAEKAAALEAETAAEAERVAAEAQTAADTEAARVAAEQAASTTKTDPPPALSATDIAKAVKEALKPEKVEEPAPEDPPEVVAALEDLEKNWGTHALAVKTLLERQATALKAEFTKILEPLQAQLTPMVAATATLTQEKFEAAIKTVHPDAYDIIPAVEAWIEKQPAYLQAAYNNVLDNGTVAEVSKFLTDYKTATGTAAPDTAAAEKLAAEKATAEAAAKKLKKMEAVTTTRTSVTAEADPADFESAWDAGSKSAKV